MPEVKLPVQRTLTIKVINSLLSLTRRDQTAAFKIKKAKHLLVTLPAASLPEPETVDFWAVRTAREVVICSMFWRRGHRKRSCTRLVNGT
jgi:hypothetical protein